MLQEFARLPDYDAETDQYNTLARHYTPMGRWMSPDPGGLKVVNLENPQTWDMYAYVENNPTTLTDPSGLGPDPPDPAENQTQEKELKDKNGLTKSQTDTQQVGNIVHNETGGLRPETKEGSGSPKDLHDAKVAIADVVQNRRKAGNYRGVASDKVRSKERNTPQYRDAQQAAAEAARSPDVTGGSTHFYLDYGQTPPSWAAGKQTITYGPFKNAAGEGDVSKGADVKIVIVRPEDQQ